MATDASADAGARLRVEMLTRQETEISKRSRDILQRHFSIDLRTHSLTNLMICTQEQWFMPTVTSTRELGCMTYGTATAPVSTPTTTALEETLLKICAKAGECTRLLQCACSNITVCKQYVKVKHQELLMVTIAKQIRRYIFDKMLLSVLGRRGVRN